MTTFHRKEENDQKKNGFGFHVRQKSVINTVTLQSRLGLIGIDGMIERGVSRWCVVSVAPKSELSNH